MCYCEGIEYFISNVFRVSHFADGPLGLVSQTPAHLDQCILHGAEESLFWGKHTCSLFTTSLRIKRGVICAVKTFCSRVIDPEKSNLWISCQLYRTNLILLTFQGYLWQWGQCRILPIQKSLFKLLKPRLAGSFCESFPEMPFKQNNLQYMTIIARAHTHTHVMTSTGTQPAAAARRKKNTASIWQRL